MSAYFTEPFIQAVADGIREHNAQKPPTPLQLIDGELVDTRPQEQVDAEWRDAVRYGLDKAASTVMA